MRHLITAAAVAAFAGALALAGNVLAAPPGQGYSITYFGPDGEVVGGATAHCSGEYLSWGDRTAIYDKRTWYCD